ncbi:3'-phosphoadenosine 5'-phosphosulfate sulfotransferase (PAPS reductase)/FAD synthetase [Halorientalis persicus]|uniref:3'-phosphoadenosine 5'-phosphosulfate sulfotransferase (PAPS reductase)/FAD synthetase n=1 Tax=Halorientalis persicus TaxID=1367881 RepID=A0A1H8W933_9EURY|nr:phosphoadenosine phosphosulfate reductase family protein [Halorientalis persicus]SEP24139.1 3'-phosphoadenosine 5'-phosphosulfate sulfotransferase (PAPS reductase)/FAD synthetase [Halorientalis persicus]
MQPQYRSPKSVFEKASSQSYDQVFALVSGGSDSTTAAHVARASEQLDIDGVIYIDTGVGIPQSRQWVQNWANEIGLPCHVVSSQYRLEKEEYHNLVYNYGMPGPGVHTQMYRNLKQKPLQRFLSDVVDGDPLLISGVREHESQRRMENIDGKGIQEDDLGIWASPIVSFTDAEVAEYQEEHEIPTNPVNEKLHVSGDCLCGAFSRSREELREIKLFFPEVFRYFEWLESHTVEAARRGRFPKEYALWGHGNAGTAGYEARLDDEQTGFNLCANCEQSCERSYDLEGTSLTDAEADLKQSQENDCSPPQFCTHCHSMIDDPVAHREECPATAQGTRRDYRQLDMLESQFRGAWITEGDPKETEFCSVGDGHDWDAGAVDVAGIRQCDHCGAFHLGEGDEPTTASVDEHSDNSEGASAETEREETPVSLSEDQQQLELKRFAKPKQAEKPPAEKSTN